MLYYILDFILYIHAISLILKFFCPITYELYLNRLKTYFQNTVIVIGFNCIYLYSRAQLFLVKLMIEVNAFIEYFNLNELLDVWNGGDGLTNDKVKFISFIKNGLVVNNYFLDNSIFEKNALINKNIDFDLIAYFTFIFDQSNFIVLYHSIPDNLEYRQVNYKFIQIEIVLEDICFNIKLSNERYNFYVVNNKIDCEFILYLLKNYYIDKINSLSNDELLNYKINIIDQDVNKIELDRNKTLTFQENNYILTEAQETPETQETKVDILLEAQNRKVTDSIVFSENEEEQKNVVEQEQENVVEQEQENDLEKEDEYVEVTK